MWKAPIIQREACLTPDQFRRGLVVFSQDNATSANTIPRPAPLCDAPTARLAQKRFPPWCAPLRRRRGTKNTEETVKQRQSRRRSVTIMSRADDHDIRDFSARVLATSGPGGQEMPRSWEVKFGHASRTGGLFDDQQALRFVRATIPHGFSSFLVRPESVAQGIRLAAVRAVQGSMGRQT